MCYAFTMENKVPFQVWLTPDLSRRLKSAAALEDRPGASLVRRLIEKEVAAIEGKHARRKKVARGA